MIYLGIKKFSKFIIKSDNSSWVLDELKKELETLLRRKFHFINQNFSNIIKNQNIFYINKYDLLNEKKFCNNLGISLFHIDPDKKFQNKKIFKLIKYNKNIKCIQITNSDIKNMLIKKGVEKNKIFKIPISVDIKKFPFYRNDQKILLKKRKNLDKFLVIGSFQKDGVGWGDGNRPKLIKGPDVFVKIIKKLNKKIKVHVVLTGPSRGYVINNLKKLNVSYEHHLVKNYSELHKYYKLLDCYIVTSRHEGGPRSILESMASGVPIYSTKVGQAKELIINGSNGWLYGNKNLNSLVDLIHYNFKRKKLLKKVVSRARNTALKNSYKCHLPMWSKFFKKLQKND